MQKPIGIGSKQVFWNKFNPYHSARKISLDLKGNLAKLARSFCFTQHFLQDPPPPKKKKSLKELWQGEPMLKLSETNGQPNPYGDVMPHLQ